MKRPSLVSSISVPPGSIVALLGPNGAGKTTTIEILEGLLAPTAGEAFVMGRSVDGNGDFVRRSIGYMPDFFGVYDDLTVFEYLEFFASAYGIGRRDRRKVVGDVLELTDLNYKQDALVDSLSRGMQQRLCLAHALVHDPKVLLLDEPASGLDVDQAFALVDLLRSLADLGLAILLIEHDMSLVMDVCEHLTVLDFGQVIAEGTPEQVQANEMVIEAYLGRSG